MSRIEILAPAGSMASVIAAVRSGADAVYLGMKRFSARASAENFDEETVSEAVAYCHERNVKVYLAVNTVLFDDELEDALETVTAAAKADIDAVIVQDMGLCEMIRRAVPQLRLHASTQMSVHTPYGAKALYELGFRRVVLSRELSLDEIREIHDFCPEIELEVFVHGALCMCLSGQCLFSSMLGGRSANRGMCAQPCRLPFYSGENDHALSLKDNSGIAYLRELQAIGVTSAKIEGRMKREEYVATAVKACREARDLGFVDEQTADRLRSVFSRAGFTDGYLRGQIGEEMFGFRRKEDVVLAGEKLFKQIRNTYKDERKSVLVSFRFEARAGEKAKLTVICENREISVFSENPVEPAKTLPLTEEKVRAQLSKTGSTPYAASDIHVQIEENISIPLSVMNTLRRRALTKLSALRRVRHDYHINEIDISDLMSEEKVVSSLSYATTKRPELLRSLKDFDLVFLDLFAFDDTVIISEHIAAEIPRALFGCESKAYEKLLALKKRGLRHVMVHNIGSWYLAKELGFIIHAGFSLNITNSCALKFYHDLGAVDAELSAEIDQRRIERLRSPIPVGIIGYGYLPLMVTRNAPLHTKNCKTEGFLQDRKGEHFPVAAYESAYEIYNCVPILMLEKIYNGCGEVFRVFRFSVENSVDKVEKILEKLRENTRFERFTRGLYHHGVKNFTIF